MSDVPDMIAGYRRGELSLDELARRFRERSWPSRRLSFPRRTRLTNGNWSTPKQLLRVHSTKSLARICRGKLSSQEYEILAGAVHETGQPQK